MTLTNQKKGEIMGVSVLTALVIQDRGNDILCQGGGPDPATGKWVGWISLQEGHRAPRPLLNTEPLYQSEAEAKGAMKRLVEDIRATEIIPHE